MLSSKDKLMMAFEKAVKDSRISNDIFTFNYSKSYVYVDGLQKIELTREDNVHTLFFGSVKEVISPSEFKELYEMAEQKRQHLSSNENEEKYKKDIDFLNKYVLPETK